MVDLEKMTRRYEKPKEVFKVGDSPGENRVQATKKEIDDFFKGRSTSAADSRSNRGANLDAAVEKTRFTDTTANRRRAETLPEAITLLTKLTTNHPLIKETSPKPLPEQYKSKKKSKQGSVAGTDQNGKPDRRLSDWDRKKKNEITKQYVELHFHEAFGDRFGVNAFTIAVVLNPKSAENILLQSETYGIYHPEGDEDNAKAAMLADILAFLGIWDYWLEEKSQGRVDHYIVHERITRDTINTLPAPQSEEDKLATFCALVGTKLLDVLVEQTNTIDQQRRKLLEIISTKSPMKNILLERKVNSRRS